MNERIYILLPVHNRREITRHFVQCLNLQTHLNYHLVLIDDGCTDGTAEMVQEYIDNLTIIRGNGSWWWAGSLQNGVNWLNQNSDVKQHDIVLIMNDDVTFKKTFLEDASTLFFNSKNTLLLPQSYNSITFVPKETGVYANLKSMTFQTANLNKKINCLPTRGLFIRLKDINEIGGFKPFLLPHYWSDYEFTIRAFSKGFYLKTTPEILITINNLETGIREIKSYKHLSLNDMFSKKSILNPYYSSIFIILSCPKIWIPINLIRIWKRTISILLKMFLYRIFYRIDAHLTDI